MLKIHRATVGARVIVTGENAMNKIFISYRRADSAQVTGRIYDRLINAYGKDHIFKDVDSIPAGVDFRKVIERSLSSCDVMLAIIGKGWVDARDKNNKRRIDSSGDFVRIELEIALRRQLPLIPVLVDDATLPGPEELPKSIREVAFRNVRPVRADPDFHKDIDRLMESIDSCIEFAEKEASLKQTNDATSQSDPNESVISKDIDPAELQEFQKLLASLPPPPTEEEQRLLEKLGNTANLIRGGVGTILMILVFVFGVQLDPNTGGTMVIVGSIAAIAVSYALGTFYENSAYKRIKNQQDAAAREERS